MRLVPLIALAAVSALALTTPAEAKRSGGGTSGWYESLEYVAPTKVRGPDGKYLSLCVLTSTSTAMFVPYWRSAEEYVLSDAECDTEEGFFRFNEGGFVADQRRGLIDGDLPLEPQISTASFLSGSWGMGIGLTLLLLGAAQKLRSVRAAFGGGRARKAAAEHGPDHEPSRLALAMINAMCHAAKADGDLSDAETQTIIAVAEQVCSETLDATDVRRLFNRADDLVDVSEFAQFGEGLTTDERRQVMMATVVLLASDGDVPMSELAFLSGMAHGLQIPLAEANQMLSKIMGTDEEEPDSYDGYSGGMQPA